MKFLFLGNDAALSLVNWDLVRNSSLFIVGINRSYMLYPDHDLLFVQDPKPILELLDQGYSQEELEALNIHTTRYFRKRMSKEKIKTNKHHKINKAEYKVLANFLKNRIVKTVAVDSAFSTLSPFSILNAMGYCYSLFKDVIKEAGGCTYYLCGCGLKYREDNNHFWQNAKFDYFLRFPTNSPGGSSKKQLNKQVLAMNNLKPILLAHEIKVVSCNEDSRLNNVFEYESLTNVLLKNQKIK